MDMEKIAKYWVLFMGAWVLFIMAAITVALFLVAKWLKVI